MLINYPFIAVFFIASVIFPFIPLIMGYLVAPKRPTEGKKSTYECGLEAIGDIWVQFRVQYYLYAIAFVVFDVEVVFLYPWAVSFGQIGVFALIAMSIFLLILVASLIYDWRKGALEWI